MFDLKFTLLSFGLLPTPSNSDHKNHHNHHLFWRRYLLPSTIGYCWEGAQCKLQSIQTSIPAWSSDVTLTIKTPWTTSLGLKLHPKSTMSGISSPMNFDNSEVLELIEIWKYHFMLLLLCCSPFMSPTHGFTTKLLMLGFPHSWHVRLPPFSSAPGRVAWLGRARGGLRRKGVQMNEC